MRPDKRSPHNDAEFTSAEPDWSYLTVHGVPKMAPNSYCGSDAEAIRVDQMDRRRSLGAILISRAGEARGAKTLWLSRHAATSSKGATSIPLHLHRGDASAVGITFTSDKLLTKKALLEAGVPTPAGKRVVSADEAAQLVRALRRPIVIKPLSGTKGKGVSVALSERKDIDAAFAQAAALGPVLAEEFVPAASEFRVIVSADECFSVVRRIPPYVRGDGKSTVRELIERKNAQRQMVPSTVGTYIQQGEATERFLSRGHATLDSTPPKGVVVGVGDVGGVSGGAEPQECFDDVSEAVKATAVRAARALPGISWCGVDIVVAEDGTPYVIEVNSSADISSSEFPFFGTPRPLGGILWEKLATEGKRRSALSKALSPGAIGVIDAPTSIENREAKPLRNLFLKRLQDRGWRTERWSASMVRATRGGETIWLAGMGTVNDLSTSTLFAARHRLVMRLAHANGVPHVPFELASSPERLRSVLERVGNDAIATRVNSPWGRGSRAGTEVLMEWEQGQRAERVVVQGRVDGHHVRVAATRDETLLIVGRRPVPQAELEMASKVAREAVKMIPQLNWAFVDIVITGSRGRGAALLEGVDRSPALRPGDLELAGSTERLFDFVEGLSRGVPKARPYVHERLARSVRETATSRSSHKTLILGDFSFGESYARAGARVVRERGYKYSTELLRPFVDGTDAFILNLETPLATQEAFPSPFTGQKRWIHWADPDATISALKDLEVDAVGLANNHVMDLGSPGLLETMQRLDEGRIHYFGAGSTLTQARIPYTLALPSRVGAGAVEYHAFYQFSRAVAEAFHPYATKNSPGCAPLSLSRARVGAEQAAASGRLRVAFPHWGRNYSWRSRPQERLGEALLSGGYDMVLGHGSHAIQEVSFVDRKWIVNSIGNGHFLSWGRWDRYRESDGVLPYGFWSVLDVTLDPTEGRSIHLRLYPVNSDNRATQFQPGPVDEASFDEITATLAKLSPKEWTGETPAVTKGQDTLGFFLRLNVGSWPVGGELLTTPVV